MAIYDLWFIFYFPLESNGDKGVDYRRLILCWVEDNCENRAWFIGKLMSQMAKRKENYSWKKICM